MQSQEDLVRTTKVWQTLQAALMDDRINEEVTFDIRDSVEKTLTNLFYTIIGENVSGSDDVRCFFQKDADDKESFSQFVESDMRFLLRNAQLSNQALSLSTDVTNLHVFGFDSK